MEQQRRRQERRNARMAWMILFIGFGLSLTLYYAGKFVGSR